MKKKIGMILSLFLAITIAELSTVDAIDISGMWSQQFGGSQNDSFKDVVETTDGDFIAIGSIANSTNPVGLGGEDGLVMKFDKAGDVVWTKLFGGTDGDYLTSISPTQDGNFILSGYTRSSIAPDTNKGGYDGWLLKIDTNGNLIWSHTYGGAQNDILNEVVETSTGYVAVGRSNGGAGVQPPIGGTTYDGWVLTVDSNGVAQKNDLYGSTNGEENISALISESDGSYIFVGTTGGQIGTNPSLGSTDGFAVKVDALGNVVWKYQYGTASQDSFFDIAKGADGNYYIAGNTYGQVSGSTALGASDGLVLSIDTNGNEQWARQYGGIAEDYFYSIAATSDGNLVLGGSTRTNLETNTQNTHLDGWFSGIDLTGEVLWNYNIGTDKNDVIDKVINTSENRFVIVGSSDGDISGNGSYGGYDAWIMLSGQKFTVDFETNGGSDVDSQEVFENENVTIPEEPTLFGHTFEAWYQEPSFLTLWDFDNDVVEGDMTLYAKWTLDEYTLNFDLNGKQGITPDSQTVGYDTLATQPTTPKSAGYVFTGWNSEADGSGLNWDFDSTKMPANNVILFAQWKKASESENNNNSDNDNNESTIETGISADDANLSSLLLVVIGAMLVIVVRRRVTK